MTLEEAQKTVDDWIKTVPRHQSIVGAKVVFSKEKEFKVSVEDIIKKVNKKHNILVI